jgi:DNA-binding transcriptional regulator YhcF (GntR family)
MKPRKLKAKPSNHKIDWIQLELIFVQGIEKNGVTYFPSVEELAEEFDINIQTAYKHSSREKWFQKRDNFKQLLAEKTKQAALDKRAAEFQEFTNDVFKLARFGLHNISADMKKGYEADLQTITNAQKKTNAGERLTPHELDASTRSLERLLKIGLLIHGLPTSINAHTGPEGGAIQIEDVTPEERQAAYERLVKKVELLGESVPPLVKPNRDAQKL